MGLETRLAIYGVLLALIGGWLVYERHHLISEGEARVKAQDAVARADQKAQDERTSAGVVNDLKAKLADLPPPAPAPALRLCVPTRVVRTQPTSGGTQPAVAHGAGEGAPGVPAGDLGLDIGPDVQASKRAAEVLAIYADETREWAVKQSRPASGTR